MLRSRGLPFIMEPGAEIRRRLHYGFGSTQKVCKTTKKTPQISNKPHKKCLLLCNIWQVLAEQNFSTSQYRYLGLVFWRMKISRKKTYATFATEKPRSRPKTARLYNTGLLYCTMYIVHTTYLDIPKSEILTTCVSPTRQFLKIKYFVDFFLFYRRYMTQFRE